MTTLAFYFAVTSLAVTAAAQQAVVYEGGRLIAGDGSAADENGTFVVQNALITAIGRAIKVPAGAIHVNLAGKTVMPAMINVHVHIGYEEIHQLGCTEIYARECARPLAAGGVLRHCGHPIGWQQHT